MLQNNIIKKYFSVFAVLALLGLGTCLLVEPALALTHHETECSDHNSEHCCFICNSSQHQWNFSKNAVLITPTDLIINFAAVIFQTTFHTSLNSVFRPPPISLRI